MNHFAPAGRLGPSKMRSGEANCLEDDFESTLEESGVIAGGDRCDLAKRG